MKKLTVLDLFSGIGGFSLGLERTGGFKTVAFCEIEKYPQQILRKHWPDVPIFDDVKKLSKKGIDGTIDVICGGPPCQPFSTASRGRRVAIDMFPEYLRLILDIMPKFIITENVSKLPIHKLKKDLKTIGYDSDEIELSAGRIGADHERVRWWLCSYSDNKGELYSKIYAKMAIMQEVCKSVWSWENYSRVLRVSDGLSDRLHITDRLKALGNSVVPYIPEIIGMAIMEREKRQ